MDSMMLAHIDEDQYTWEYHHRFTGKYLTNSVGIPWPSQTDHLTLGSEGGQEAWHLCDLMTLACQPSCASLSWSLGDRQVCAPELACISGDVCVIGMDTAEAQQIMMSSDNGGRGQKEPNVQAVGTDPDTEPTMAWSRQHHYTTGTTV